MKRFWSSFGVFIIFEFWINSVYVPVDTQCNSLEGVYGNPTFGIAPCTWSWVVFGIQILLFVLTVTSFFQAGPANVWTAIWRQKRWLGVLCLIVLIGGGALYWNELREEQQSQANYYKNVEVNNAVRSTLGPALEKYYLNTVTEGSSATMYFIASAPANESTLRPAISVLKQQGYSQIRWSVAASQ